jgi:DNA-binding transcriptional ArsR family regulator
MQRIYFTASDLARTRLRATAGAETESEFASELLGHRGSAVYNRWRRQASKNLPPRSASSSPPSWVEVWRAAVAPHWSRILAYLEGECDARGRIVMAGGVEQLLATLHSRITWDEQVLEVHDGPDEDVHLDGRGLVLSPSVFLDHRSARFISPRREGNQAALVFAAPPDAEQAAILWDDNEDAVPPLGALVGQTRAAALRALRAACTTGQLADQLGISAPCASQHTAILRKSGLITTRRVRNIVLHTVTPLGVALLDGKVLEPTAVARLSQASPPSGPRPGAVLAHAVEQRGGDGVLRHPNRLPEHHSVVAHLVDPVHPAVGDSVRVVEQVRPTGVGAG